MKNMLGRLEDFLLKKFAGKVIARAAVTIAAFVAGPVVQGAAAKAGIDISVNVTELEAGMVLGAHAAFEWYKNWRAKKEAKGAAQSQQK